MKSGREDFGRVEQSTATCAVSASVIPWSSGRWSRVAQLIAFTASSVALGCSSPLPHPTTKHPVFQEDAAVVGITPVAVFRAEDVARWLSPKYGLTGKGAVEMVLPTTASRSRALSQAYDLQVAVGTDPSDKLAAPETVSSLRDVDLRVADPVLTHHVATGLFQEVGLLERYLRHVPVGPNEEAYVVRYQVTHIPKRHEMPFDALVRLRFALGDESKSSPKVYPVFVSDQLETTATAWANAAEITAAIDAEANKTKLGARAARKILEEARGRSLNSLVAVVSEREDTLVLRLGGYDIGGKSRGAIPRSYWLTVLVVTPKGTGAPILPQGMSRQLSVELNNLIDMQRGNFEDSVVKAQEAVVRDLAKETNTGDGNDILKISNGKITGLDVNAQSNTLTIRGCVQHRSSDTGRPLRRSFHKVDAYEDTACVDGNSDKVKKAKAKGRPFRRATKALDETTNSVIYGNIGDKSFSGDISWLEFGIPIASQRVALPIAESRLPDVGRPIAVLDDEEKKATATIANWPTGSIPAAAELQITQKSDKSTTPLRIPASVSYDDDLEVLRLEFASSVKATASSARTCAATVEGGGATSSPSQPQGGPTEYSFDATKCEYEVHVALAPTPLRNSRVSSFAEIILKNVSVVKGQMPKRRSTFTLSSPTTALSATRGRATATVHITKRKGDDVPISCSSLAVTGARILNISTSKLSGTSENVVKSGAVKFDADKIQVCKEGIFDFEFEALNGQSVRIELSQPDEQPNSVAFTFLERTQSPTIRLEGESGGN